MTQQNKNTLSRRARIGLMGGGVALAAVATMGMAAPAQAASSNTWDKLAACESGGNWAINTGNGYSGGLQFTASTWKAYGGTGSAHNASKAEQIRVAKKVQAGQGWGAWPACSSKLGLRGSAAASAGATSSGTNTSGTSSSSSSSRYTATKKQSSTYSSSKSGSSYRSSTAQSATPKQRTAVSTPARSSAPALVLPKHVKDSGKVVTVKSGDSLAKIANDHKLDSWLSLYALNKDDVQNPNLVFVGQKLHLPSK